jgi:ergothioneine biosynthesis protein EgtB
VRLLHRFKFDRIKGQPKVNLMPDHDVAGLRDRYERIRNFSARIIESLSPEDCVIQSMPDASPTRWHLAHTTWFFETFVLKARPGYRPFHDQFAVLFNSYYNAVGEQFPRPRRGLLSRPSLREILSYREHVDERLLKLLSEEASRDELGLIALGLEHEQQHQELMLTDIKHVLSINPLFPSYRDDPLCLGEAGQTAADEWAFEEGLYEIGSAGAGFAFDNESPRHLVFLGKFALKSRLVTNGEYLEFMQDGGYQCPKLWLSLGWNHVAQSQWQAPLYWHMVDGEWFHFTLNGLKPVPKHLPVCHVSYFEADAFARWAGLRLPTEFEWEAAATGQPVAGHFADLLMQAGNAIHPSPVSTSDRLDHLYGNLWEWTASPYVGYPGYTPAAGAIGEYNGKFMCNQFVLRGGSCATPSGHVRPTYRNFFPPETRWQFSGLRLAR